jgi:hypothetical protein
MSEDKKDILTPLRKDKKVKKFNKMIEEGIYCLDTTSMLEDLDRMHTTKKIRLLKKGDVIHHAQDNIVEAIVQNSAYRSSVMEIKMKCYRVHEELQNHYDVLADYLKTEYRSILASHFRTNDERNSAIAVVLKKANYYLQQLEITQEVADMTINDIDQGNWSIKNLIEVLTLATKPENV